MSTKFKFSPLLVVFALALGLSACGGGGGGSSSAPVVPVAPVPVVPPVTASPWKGVVTSVPTPTYTGDKLLAFNLLNSLRAATGVGLLAQNPALDKSAANHVNYLFNYPNFYLNGVSFHSEVVGNLGFTGTTPQARATAAGYVGLVSEDGIASTGNVSSNTIGATGWGDLEVHTLINNTVYHRFSLLSSWTDVGISVVSDNLNPTNTFTVINIGNASELPLGQLPAAPVVYPYPNQVKVDTTFIPVSETPNPAPDLGTYANPIAVGLPVTISLDSTSLLGSGMQKINASDVVISTFTLTAQGSAAPTSARIITAAGVSGAAGLALAKDPVGYFTAGQICLLPITPLAVNTVYNAVFTATVKGKPVNLKWSFTTGTNK